MPFSNMYRQLPIWYSRPLSLFENFHQDQLLEVTRVPPTAQNPPCLKVTHRTAGSDAAGVALEFLRMSLPVICQSTFSKNK